MSLDFQSIRQQIKQLVKVAVIRERQLQVKREKAAETLIANAQNLAHLRKKVADVVQKHDPSLRCALPVNEALNTSFPLPPLPDELTILAVDGSQIAPDRNAEINFALLNVGAVQMRLGSSKPPITTMESRLLYNDQLYTSSGTITETSLALKRDLNERTKLVELAEEAEPPVLTITDGPLELWGAKTMDSQQAAEFQESLKIYLDTLSKLHRLNVTTAGYVDRPSANLVVRLLEVAMIPQVELSRINELHPLQGVTDFALYRHILKAGERSPVYAMQSQSANSYPGSLALHFFYLNVGREGFPYLSRVEVPAWVVEDRSMLENLHAALVDQALTIGARPYPYLLHRAHETAVVRFRDKEQVTQMIALKLRAQGMDVGEISSKQFAKQTNGRTRFEG